MDSFSFNYAAVCSPGLHREKNQDNLWCGGVYLECENNGLAKTIHGSEDAEKQPIFAVFDGLGGETDGEQAAWIAAFTFDRFLVNRINKCRKTFLREAFDSMNDAVCSYAISNRINQMGATAVVLFIKENVVSVCNLGDSRAYLYRKGELTLLSKDHVSRFESAGKPYLTQFLGISQDEFMIEPFVYEIAFRKGDRYLLCSDGLTDMVSETEISSVLSLYDRPARVAENLLKAALAAGGRDNITVITCDVIAGQNGS